MGRKVECHYSLKSFHSTKKSDAYFNNINGYRIDVLSGTAQAPKQEAKPDPVDDAGFSGDPWRMKFGKFGLVSNEIDRNDSYRKDLYKNGGQPYSFIQM